MLLGPSDAPLHDLALPVAHRVEAGWPAAPGAAPSPGGLLVGPLGGGVGDPTTSQQPAAARVAVAPVGDQLLRRLLAVQPIAVRVIDFSPQHTPAIGALLAEHGWESRYVTGQLTAATGLSGDPDGRVLVALTGDQVVGFAAVQVHQWNRLAQLHGLAV